MSQNLGRQADRLHGLHDCPLSGEDALVNRAPPAPDFFGSWLERHPRASRFVLQVPERITTVRVIVCCAPTYQYGRVNQASTPYTRCQSGPHSADAHKRYTGTTVRQALYPPRTYDNTRWRSSQKNEAPHEQMVAQSICAPPLPDRRLSIYAVDWSRDQFARQSTRASRSIPAPHKRTSGIS